jgi:pyruvate dehydrogenase E2 component (dihydrolipoamide acetyltransferase)
MVAEQSVLMPHMGYDMKEGAVNQWMKKVGDTVARGEVLAEIQTDKANIELESFHDGVLKSVLVQPGEWVPVGTPIAVIEVS